MNRENSNKIDAIKILGNIAYVEGDKLPEKDLDEVLSCANPKARFTKAYRTGKWDGRQHFYFPVTKSFSAGLLFDLLSSEIFPRACAKDVDISVGDRYVLPVGEGLISITTYKLYLYKRVRAYARAKINCVETISALDFLRQERRNLLKEFPRSIPKQFGKFTLRDYQQKAVENACIMTNGIVRMATGSGKCLGKGTALRMFDGTVKNVEAVVVGDLLMGDDSTARKVLSVCNGWDKLYKIKQNKGMDYVVNSEHILTLRYSNADEKIIDIALPEYLVSTAYTKNFLNGFKVSVNPLQKKDSLVTGIQVEESGVGEYYGFELDGNGRFLLEDFTVTHNTLAQAAVLQTFGGGIIVLRRKDLLSQTLEKFEEYFNQSIGVIGFGKVDLKQYTIASVDTLYKRLDDPKVKAYMQHVGCVINDECHLSTTGTWMKVFRRFKTPIRYGFSGTPYHKDDLQNMQLRAATGDLVCDITTADLQKRDYLAQAELTLIPIETPENKWHLYWQAARKELVVENDHRNARIVSEAQKRVLEGKRCLVIVWNSLEHGKRLLDMFTALRSLSVDFAHGSCSMAVRDKIRKDFDRGNLDVLVTTSLYDFGIDIPDLDVLILAYGGKSFSAVLQRIGRGLRPKKGYLEVIDFLDMTNKYLSKHTNNRLSYYEEEAIFRKINVLEGE